MDNRNDRISKIASVFKSKVVLLTREDVFVYPSGHFFDFTFEEIKTHIGENFKGYNIYYVNEMESEILCIQAREYFFDERIELSIMLLDESSEDALGMANSFEGRLIHILENASDTKTNISRLGTYSNKCNGYLGIISGFGYLPDENSDVEASIEIKEIIEIVKNSIDCKAVFLYGNRLVFVIDESKKNDEEIEEDIISLSKNLTMEMLKEYVIAFDGPFEGVEEFVRIYTNCIDSLSLKTTFKLKENILTYNNLIEYVALDKIDERTKLELIENVFKFGKHEINSFFDQEILNTIEAFFNNNLNISDTSKELYIHRNTLLYRLDKIHKMTGYDLRNFKQAWIFRLAWVIMKSL